MDCACEGVQRSDGPSWFIWFNRVALEDVGTGFSMMLLTPVER